ncbi:AsmA family protein [Dysgonomonas sp. ZJ709]|uniref:AsmA family protein n=1 Tax=Dysgonomonas sp. ZJ709 TaxID=2709797 RepID=UPI0013EAAB36|nr:AsmA family protein [Dysgonomonas sp. ZJ709]
MKKGLKISGIVILILVVILIALPFLFSGIIKKAAIKKADEQLNAKLEIRDLRLNLISNFPYATLSLYDVILSGIDNFEGDTLIQAKSVEVSMSLINLIRSRYNISQLKLDSSSVYIKILPSGQSNWDIVKKDSSKINISNDSKPFKLQIQNILLTGCNAVYEDQISHVKTIITGWNGTISADFAGDESSIKTTSIIDEFSLFIKDIPYLDKLKLTTNSSFSADLKNKKFTLTKSDVQLNEVKTHIDGSFTLVEKKGINFDFKLTALDTDFKDILSVVPSIYTKDFEDLEASGAVSIDGYVKGLMQDEVYPAFSLKLFVHNSMFKYSSLPKSVDNINIDFLMENEGGSLDSTKVDISRFDFNIGGNAFKSNLSVQTPVSDLHMKVYLKGILDLDLIKEIYPLDKGLEIGGKIDADLDMAANLSNIEKDEYDKIKIAGQLNLSNILFKREKQPTIQIKNAAAKLNHQLVNLSSFNIRIGNNDLSIKGRLENLLGYIVADKTLKGQLDIKSAHFNVNDFTGNGSKKSSKPFIVPKNLDLALTASLKQVTYEKTDITNLDGNITIKSGVITMKNLTANTLGGYCKANGSYNTAQNPSKPLLNMALDMNKMSFFETFQSVKAIGKFAPVFEKIIGTYSMKMSFTTIIDQNQDQTLANIKGSGTMKTDVIKVKGGIKILDELAAKVKLESLSSFIAKNVIVEFTVQDGKLTTKPFDVKILGTKLNLGGSTGLDKSINYKVSLYFPGPLRVGLINNIAMTVKGTTDNPKFMIDPKSMLVNSATSIPGQLIGGGILGQAAVNAGTGLAKNLLKKKK